MFTGIIEDLGKVKAIASGKESMRLTIELNKITEDIGLGDSIAINGVCLTVVEFTTIHFTVDVMPETVKATNIQTLQVGSAVNLERAVASNGRFGGHFVSGHIDGTGMIIRKRKVENAVYIDIGIEKELSKYCVHKGSVAIDGISLTIFDVRPTQITVSIIPHTYTETVLGLKKERDIVNIENDLLGKYVFQFVQQNQEKPSITMDFLKSHGF